MRVISTTKAWSVCSSTRFPLRRLSVRRRGSCASRLGKSRCTWRQRLERTRCVSVYTYFPGVDTPSPRFVSFLETSHYSWRVSVCSLFFFFSVCFPTPAFALRTPTVAVASFEQLLPLRRRRRKRSAAASRRRACAKEFPLFVHPPPRRGHADNFTIGRCEEEPSASDKRRLRRRRIRVTQAHPQRQIGCQGDELRAELLRRR